MRRASLVGVAALAAALAALFVPMLAVSQPGGVSVPTLEEFRALEARVAALEGGATSTTTAPTSTAAPTTTVGAACSVPAGGDQAALTTALAACPDGTEAAPTVARFPAGATYTVTGPVVVDGRRDLVIDGNGSTLRNAAPNTDAPSPAWRLRLATRVTLRNLTVEGGFHPATTNRASSEGVTLRTTNQFNAGVLVAGGTGVRLEGLTTRNIWGDPVLVVHSDSVLPGDPGRGSQATDVHVVHLDAATHTRQCVAVASVAGFWLEDSTCRDSWYGGVDLEIDPNVAGHTVHGAHVLRSTFEGFYFYAIAAPVTNGRPDAVGQLEFRANQILTPPDTCRSPVIVKAQEDTSGGTVSDVVVADNQVTTLYNGIELTDVTSGAVTGNHVTITVSPGYCGPPAGVPVKLVRSPVTASGNTATGY